MLSNNISFMRLSKEEHFKQNLPFDFNLEQNLSVDLVKFLSSYVHWATTGLDNQIQFFFAL